MKTKEQINITVNKIIYFKEDTHWYILKTNGGIAKGPVNFAIQNGDSLCLEGFHQISKFNGELEFIFNSAMLSIPENPRALLHYAVELTKGLGPVAESRIWELYGPDWQKSDLADVPHLTDESRFEWQNTLNRLKAQKEQTQAIAFLISKGATMNMACAAWNRWKESTVSIVTVDCYALAELPHYGFTDVDKGIRQNFGITDKDLRRVEAATLYVMNEISQTQGTLIDADEIIKELAKIIPDAQEIIGRAVTNLDKKNKIVIVDKDNFALIEDWRNESAVWEKISA